MPDRHGTLWMLAILAMGACGPPESGPPTGLEDGLEADFAPEFDLAGALRAEGATVEDLGRLITSAVGVPGRALLVDGARIEAYPFPDEAAATAEAEALPRSRVHWAPPLRLYRRGSLLVLWAGTDPSVADLLQRVLGPPVAQA